MTLVNLVSSAHLNGTMGEVSGFDKDKQRYVVKLADACQLLFKGTNLVSAIGEASVFFTNVDEDSSNFNIENEPNFTYLKRWSL